MPDRLVDPQAGDLISSAQERIQNEILRRTVSLPNSITDSLGTRMVVRGAEPVYNIVSGKLDADLNQGSYATVSIWDGDPLADTGENVTGYDWMLDSGKKLSIGTKVWLVWRTGKWYVIQAAPCPVDQ